MPCLRASNKIAASIPDQCSLEKPLDPCVAEYSVTGRTRRETCGSICKALFKGEVINQARFMQWQTGTSQARQRVLLEQAWVDDQQTISNRARQRDNPGTRAIVQERCKQSPNSRAKGKSRKHGQESKHTRQGKTMITEWALSLSLGE